MPRAVNDTGEVTRVTRQSRVLTADTAAAAYTLVNLLLRWRHLGTCDAVAFAKLGAATNGLAFNAPAILTIRGLSLLPGRKLLAAKRVAR